MSFSPPIDPALVTPRPPRAFDLPRRFSAAGARIGRASSALTEQGLFAGGNFVLNLTMAATIPAADYGAFVFAFTIFMIAAGLHNALILEPATVLRTTLYDTQPRSYCRAQLILHAVVMAVLAGILGVIGVFLVASRANAVIGHALIAAACASPFILLHWTGRRFHYVLRRPATALAGSAIYFTALCAMTLAARSAGKLSASSGFAILGLASTTAAIFLMEQAGVFGRMPSDAPRLRLRSLAAERWTYGRWLIGAVCIESAIVPGLTVTITVLLGLSAVGVLRALQVFAVPAGHIVTAISALVLPALARDYQHGRLGPLREKMNRVVIGVVAGAVLFEVALLILHTPLERLVYGGKFAQYAFLIPIVGAAALLEATAATYAMLLSAMQRPGLYLASVASIVPVTLIGAYVCISQWGITGAAITAVLTAAVSVGIRRHLANRRPAARQRPSAAPEAARQSMSSAFKSHLPEPWLGAVRQARARSRQLMHWSRRELRHTLRCGASVSIVTPSDWAVYNEIFVDGEYDRAIRAVTNSEVKAPLILDLGANVGYFALRFADLWSRARGDQSFSLISIEGSPSTYARLAAHLAQSAIAARCTACHGLVGRRSGSAAICRSALSSLNSIRSRQSFSRAQVAFVDLETIVPPARPITLMKCDIEGAEELFIESYPRLLQLVSVFVVEFHPKLNDVNRCRRLLHDAGLVNHLPLRTYSDGSVEVFSREELAAHV
jgi:FkbM family methyltransferase